MPVPNCEHKCIPVQFESGGFGSVPPKQRKVGHRAALSQLPPEQDFEVAGSQLHDCTLQSVILAGLWRWRRELRFCAHLAGVISFAGPELSPSNRAASSFSLA